MIYAILFLAIVFEVVGLTALKETQGFTRLLPSLIFAGGLAASFYLEALALRHLPVGLTYAVWSGMGIVGMTLVGFIAYGEKMGAGSTLGLLLIVAGIAVLHLFAPGQGGASAARIAHP